MSKQNIVKANGVVIGAQRGEQFCVELDNGIAISASLSGKIRQNHIRITPGDRVEVEMSPYDLTRGRIVYRRSKQK